MALPVAGTNDVYTQGILDAFKAPAEADVSVTTSGARTLDVSAGGPIYGYAITGSGAITSLTVTNPTNLQQITILMYRSAAQTVTWPTNFRFASNTAPPLAANTRTYIRFQYLSSTGLWYEMGRAADVPNS